MLPNPPSITLAITGASGSVYGLSLLKYLLKANAPINLLISKAARMVLATETKLNIPSNKQEALHLLRQYSQADENQIKLYSQEEWTAPFASGSGVADAMVICPCSMGTIAAVAHGNSDNLIERAADVSLKERKPLIIVPRETPYSAIHLKNMLQLTEAGAIILPANPGFYHQPKTINDIVNFVVARILNQLNIKHDLVPKWGE